MSAFAFELDQHVSIIVSQERGQIIGRAQYSTSENSYFLRYQAADGRAVNAWWEESALTDADPNCERCKGSGISRAPYASELGPCLECRTSLPISATSASTAASDGGLVVEVER